MTIDLIRGRGFYAYMETTDDMYRFVQPENRNVQQAVRSRHPLADMDYNQLMLNSALMHAIFTKLWSKGREIALFDIGAYIADFALDLCSFARDKGRIVSAEIFEPGATRHLILKNIKVNELDHFTVRAEAVSDAPGVSSFSMPAGHWNTSHLTNTDTGDNVVTVPVVDILSVLDAARDKFVVMKIDTEGVDLRILRRILCGYDRLDSIAIIFEYTPRLYPADMRREVLTEMLKHFSLYNIGVHNYPSLSEKAVCADDLDQFIARDFSDHSGYTDMLAIPNWLRI